MKSYMVGAAALCAVLTVACGDEAQGCHAKQPNPENRGKHLGWFKHDQMPHCRILEKFDKDGDGKLSDEEKAAARQAREERWKALLAKYDKDGDGLLSEEEREAARRECGRGKGRGLCPCTSNGPHGNNGVGNGVDPQPAGNPPVINDGEGAGPGNPGAKNH